MVFEREDLSNLSKKELKEIIIAQSKVIEHLRKKYAHLNFNPHYQERDMSMNTTYYNPYQYGKMWWV